MGVALAYADDVFVLAPSKHALNKMLQICSEFATMYEIIFNATKSQFMYFSDRKSDIVNNHVVMNGQVINHLCLPLGQDSEQAAIKQCIDDMYSRLNVMMAEFRFAPRVVLNQLYKSFCLSMYGSQISHLGLFVK